MEEQTVYISAGDVQLESRWLSRDSKKAAIISHPHPLYGGSMHNLVVKKATEAFGSLGYGTLRFNFRGVGGSTGVFGAGVTEREDVSAVFKFVKDQGVETIVLAGYSFGAWVMANTAFQLAASGLVLISPPITVLEVGFSELVTPFWFVCGDLDQFCSPDALKLKLNGAPQLQQEEWIEGADHFYSGKLNELYNTIRKWFS
jgi:uncharacterized protein